MPEPRPTDPTGDLSRVGDPGEAGPDRSSEAEPTISEQYGWLFRAPNETDDLPTEDEQQTAVRQPLAAQVVAAEAPAVGEDDEERRGRRVGLIIAIAIVLVVLLGAGALLVNRTFGGDRVAGGPLSSPSPTAARPSAAPSTATSESPAPGTETSPSGANYAGPVVAVRADKVTADCQAPAAVDDAGKKVSYAPELTEDGDNATAWRCDGSALGKQLTLTLPEETKVAELGLVNGYAKTDPKTRKDRYGEYRRITAVTWILDGGVAVHQTLQDGPEDPQTIRIPTTESRQVVLRIDAATDPGSNASTRDAVLISEISVGAPQ